MLPLVLASNNPGKLAELKALFRGLPVELLAQGERGIAEAEEPHITFVENALAKARHAAAGSGLAAIADDSGLCVEALGGAPGVDSAHFAPLEAQEGSGDARETRRARQDAANNRRLLKRLAGCDQRRASFVTALVAVRHAADPQPLIAFGRWGGEILHAPRGSGGFGYDPLVFIPALGRSVAELHADEKNTLSHRALATREMLALMRAHWLA
jgi:XTP/dITP diphosphohydrolase